MSTFQNYKQCFKVNRLSRQWISFCFMSSLTFYERMCCLLFIATVVIQFKSKSNNPTLNLLKKKLKRSLLQTLICHFQLVQLLLLKILGNPVYLKSRSAMPTSFVYITSPPTTFQLSKKFALKFLFNAELFKVQTLQLKLHSL